MGGVELWDSFMRIFLITIFIIGFVGIATLGIFGMHIGMQNHNGDCIATTAQGTDCPEQSSLVDCLIFRLNAFKNFSIAIVSNSTTLFLVLFLLVVGTVLGSLLENQALSQRAYFRPKNSDLFRPSAQHELFHWLALHENSPAIL